MSRVKQLGWFVGIWVLSVAALAVVGSFIRWALV